MSLNLNPWLALLLGILIGWLLEWLLELWFFRRRRLECQRRLGQVEADLRSREAELRDAWFRADSLQAELATAKVETPRVSVAAPGVKVEARKVDVKAPEVEIAPLSGKIELPQVQIEAPKVELPEVKAEFPDAHEAKLEAPKVELPKAGLAAGVGAGLAGLAASIKKPDAHRVEFEAPKVELPEVKAELPDAHGAKLEVPKVELPKVEAELPHAHRAEFEAPTVELPKVELPKVELPGAGLVAGVGAGLAGMAAGVKGPRAYGAEVEAPQVDVTPLTGKVELPEVKADLPNAHRAEIEAPKVELPEVKAELPDAHWAKLEAPQVELPEVKAEFPAVKLEAPKVELPDVGAELPDVHGAKLEAPRAELPGAGLAAGVSAGLAGLAASVKGPEVELPEVKAELPKLTLESAKTEVEWPAVSAAVTEAGIGAVTGEVKVPAASIGVELPQAEGRLPQVAVDATLPAAGFVADDLAAIKGIGPKYAAQLSAAGITSFTALAATPPDRLAQIIQAPDWRKTDYGAWTAEAAVQARQPRRQIVGDPLEDIEGIGPVYAGKLRTAGITTFAQLAASDEVKLAGIIVAPAWRKVDYGSWIAQARLAAAGDEAGLKALQAKLYGRAFDGEGAWDDLEGEDAWSVAGVGRRGDNLNLVGGIGEKTARALQAAGITSFAALAVATPEKLGEITKAAGVRGGDFDAWISEAKLRAAGKRVPWVHRACAAKNVASCPQDLSKVKGIGTIYEQKLYAAGIGSFWNLAQADVAELARIFEIKDFQKVDLDAVKADALRIAEETNTVGRSWDGTPPDDFEPFGGIGEVFEGRLYDAGICTYRGVANATVERLAEICKAPAWRTPDYAGWIAQARARL